MRVGELMAKLADMPQDAPVLIMEYSSLGEDVPLEHLEVTKFPDGTWAVFVS